MKMVLNIAEIVSKLDPLTLPLTYVTDHHLEVLLLKNLGTPRTMREMTFAEIVMTLAFNHPKSDQNAEVS